MDPAAFFLTIFMGAIGIPLGDLAPAASIGPFDTLKACYEAGVENMQRVAANNPGRHATGMCAKKGESGDRLVAAQMAERAK